MIIDIIAITLEVLLQIILIDKLADKNYKNKYLYGILYECMSVFGMTLLNIKGINGIWSILWYLITILYIKLNYRLTWKKSITIFIICSVIISASQLLFMLPFSFSKKQIILEGTIQLIISIESIIFILFLYKKISSKIILCLLGKENKINRVIVFLCGLILTYGLATYKYWQYLKAIDYVLIIIFSITVALLIYLWQKEKYKRQEKEDELITRKLYEETFKDLIENIRGRQHEFNNHLTVLQSQIKICKNYEELVCRQEKYIRELGKEDKEFYKLLVLNNHILAGLLYSKLLKAKQQEISIEYNIEIENLKLNLSITKIVEIISILLDNAIAKLNEMEKEQRKIRVLIKEENGLFIEIANRSEYIPNDKLQQFFKKGYTTKGEGHGYGLYNLKNIVIQNKGKVSIKNEKIKEENYIVFQTKIY